MSAFVLIIVFAQLSFDGGVSTAYVPFATLEACQAAAKAVRADVDARFIQLNRTPRMISLQCAATGIK